jgi:hypothetical protein
MTLEEEITKLTDIWYEYINQDHHKDRDCHWYIHKTWSYGEEPYYIAYHYGYILDHWTSPRCATEEMASTLLRDKLKRELKDAIKQLSGTEYWDENDKVGFPSYELRGLTKAKTDAIIKAIQEVL